MIRLLSLRWRSRLTPLVLAAAAAAALGLMLSAPDATAQTGAVTLQPGFTYVTYLGPTLPVADGLNDVAADSVTILRYDGPTQRWESVWNPGLPAILQTGAALVGGTPYFVFSTTVATWTFPGGGAPPQTDVTLYPGFNDVAYGGPTMSVESAIEEIADRVTRVFAWNATGQGWQTWDSALPASLRAFSELVNGQVYTFLVAGQQVGGDDAIRWLFPADVNSPAGPTVEVTSPLAALGLDPFYTKYRDADGIAVVSSAEAADGALVSAVAIVGHMLSDRPDIRDAMIRNGGFVGIMGEAEVTTDIPEHADLYAAFPGVDWDTRARGLGATLARPITTAAEENLLCRPAPRDAFVGESIFVHEFAHSMVRIGIATLPEGPAFGVQLAAAYLSAVAAGRFENTYALTDPEEYWAEGVQSWFNANLEAEPANGIHNFVNTRQELREYDPLLAALIAGVFPDSSWDVPCGVASAG